jgi:hypothetical protein
MPYLVYQAESALPTHQIAETLQRFVGRANWLGVPPRDPVSFFGSITSTGFRIMRVVRGRDSFNPVLYGQFSPSDHGTRVRVVMTLHPVVWVFMFAWSIINGYWALAGLRDHNSADFYGGLGFLVFAWVMAVPVFYYDAAQSKRLLRESLELRDI